MKRAKGWDLRDWHIYGGITTAGFGLGVALGPGWGVAAVGAVLAYLGIWRMG